MLPGIRMLAIKDCVTSWMQAAQPVVDLVVVGCALGSAVCSVAPALMGGLCGALWRSVARR